MTKKGYLTTIKLFSRVIIAILINASGFYILLTSSLKFLPKYFITTFVLTIIAYGFFRSLNIKIRRINNEQF